MTFSRLRAAVIALSIATLIGCGPEPKDETDGGGADTGADVADTGIPDADGGSDADTDPSDGGDTADDPDMGDADGGMPDGDGGMDADGGDGGDTGPDKQLCGTLPSPPPGQLCSVNKGDSDLLLLKGDVLTDQKVYDNGVVLVDRSGENGKIVCTGCDCASEIGNADPTEIVCPDGVISPGLVNPHDHLGWATSGPYDNGDTRYNHRHEWRTGARGAQEINTPGSDFSREATLHGELRHLLGGATMIAGSTRGTSAQGLLRNPDNADATGGIQVDVDYSTFPLDDVDGTIKEMGCDYGRIDSYSVLREDIYLPHIAEGIDAAAENEFECLSDAGNGGRDLVEDNTSIIHGIGMTAEDVREFASQGGHLVWSPRTNISLYGQTADVLTYRKYRVPIALGTDWPISGSMNMLRELSCAKNLSQNHYSGALTDRDLWRMATYNGALALGVDDQLGKLQKDYVADIAIFNGTDEADYSAVVEADSADVHLVMRGGQPLYGDSPLIQGMVDSSEIGSCTQVNACGNQRHVCVERDTSGNADGSVDFDTLKNAAKSGAYPLFQCQSSMTFEPSCTPQRSGEYNGMMTMDDPDGDGIATTNDNCPNIFNPSRPLEGQQPDADEDGKGDVCDSCPTASSGGCHLDDWDNDGVKNSKDNCPYDANRAQADGDGDGVGDKCDASTTPYDIKNGAHSAGDRVELDGLVVTAVNDDQQNPGVFVQVPPDAGNWKGPENSGLYIFLGSGTVPDRGDLISLQGRLEDYFGRIQVSGVTNLTVDATGHQLPQPAVVDPCEIATGAAKATTYRDVLVTVENLTVSDANPDAPGNDYKEFAVGGCMMDDLRIDDLLFEITPDPKKGETFQSITGPLHYSFSNSKLLPRDMNDVVFGAADLKAIEPQTSYLEAGATGTVPTPNLELVLTRPSSSATTVNLTYPNSAKLDGPATVTIPAGQTREPLPLNAKMAASSPTDFATVEGSVSGGMAKSADVLVYDDALTRTVDSASSMTSILQPGGSLQVTVRLNIPASSGGETVNLTTSSDLGLPAQMPTIPAGQFETTFTVQAGMTTGQKSLTADVGGSGATVSVNVKSGATGDCLVFSEYIEGGGSNNKAVELYNCGGTQLDMQDFGICIAFNGSTSCSSATALMSQTVKPGEVYTVCKSTSGSSGDPVADIKNNCQETQSGVINFNGNDVLMLFEDKNGNGSYDSSGDAVMDMFGQLSMPPTSSSPWKDTTYRRCDPTPYQGMSPFKVGDLYNSYAKNDASDYGKPPTKMSCP